MDAKLLREFQGHCPIRLTIVDGEELEVDGADQMMVSDFEATVLTQREGVWRNVTRLLATVESVEQLRRPI